MGTVCAMPPVTPARISLPDRYRVVRHLANGGMASVWEAHDELLDRDVAVKLLASHLGEDERARKRFQREARAAAGLSSHPNVVTIYDVGEHKNRVFMVMEIMRGGTLGDRLKGDREIPHQTALRWLHEAAAALDTAHEAGVVHRDIKPGNLLLDGRDRLAVADFGIARLAWEDQLTATGQVLGTAAYLSPEQAMGEAATAASDRYAFAVVAYELLTGTRPFEAEHFAAQARAHVEDPPPPASERAPELSRAVDAVLERGLAKDPADRWDSSEDVRRRAGAHAREAGGTDPADAAADRTQSGRRGGAPRQRDEARADDGGGGRDGGGRGATAGGRNGGGRDGNGGRGAAGGRGGRDTSPAARRRAATAAPERRRSGAPLLIGLGLIALLAVVGAIALANRRRRRSHPARAGHARGDGHREPGEDTRAHADGVARPDGDGQPRPDGHAHRGADRDRDAGPDRRRAVGLARRAPGQGLSGAAER